eukprot:scaffold1170_cov174-Amphora_coffeaeformis.AAC.6
MTLTHPFVRVLWYGIVYGYGTLYIVWGLAEGGGDCTGLCTEKKASHGIAISRAFLPDATS